MSGTQNDVFQARIVKFYGEGHKLQHKQSSDFFLFFFSWVVSG